MNQFKISSDLVHDNQPRAKLGYDAALIVITFRGLQCADASQRTLEHASALQPLDHSTPHPIEKIPSTDTELRVARC